MSDIERLDFSKPPPGFEIRNTSYEDGDSEVGGYGVNIAEWSWFSGDGCTDSAATENACISSAWEFFEEENDPPGMWSGFRSVIPHTANFEPMAGISISNINHLQLCVDAIKYAYPEGARAAGRAAAWAWYKRRVMVAEGDWPECLAWSDGYLDSREVLCVR